VATWLLRLPIDGRAVAAAVGFNAIAVAALAEGDQRLAVALVLAPVLAVLMGMLLAADGTVLVLAALALELTLPQLNDPLPLGGAAKVYPADLVVGLALAAWLLSRLAAIRSGVPAVAESRRWSPVLGLPLLLFGIAVGSAVIRGHARYGAPLLGSPVRMILYAAIAVAVLRTTPERLYRGIVIVFYAGAVWELFNAAYYAATGGSQSIAADLSTGGTRLLSVSVSLYLAGAFFLALINLSHAAPGRAKILHATMLFLSAGGIVLSFSRGTFIAVGVLGLLLVLFLQDVRVGALAALPLAVVILAVAGLVLARTNSTVVPTFINRISPSIAKDPSVQWRKQANKALWQQVRESPLYGVGFGRNLRFSANNLEFETGQEAHNDFLFLLAATGIFGLATFVLLVVRALTDAIGRYRRSTNIEERALLMFAIVTALGFVLNGLVEPLITLPSIMLTIWALLLVPATVKAPEVATAPESSDLRVAPGI
jgi:O-antigen ligase